MISILWVETKCELKSCTNFKARHPEHRFKTEVWMCVFSRAMEQFTPLAHSCVRKQWVKVDSRACCEGCYLQHVTSPRAGFWWAFNIISHRNGDKGPTCVRGLAGNPRGPEFNPSTYMAVHACHPSCRRWGASQPSWNSELLVQWDPVSKYKVNSSRGRLLVSSPGLHVHPAMYTLPYVHHMYMQKEMELWY